MAGVDRLAMAYNNVYLVEAAGERVLIDTGPDYRGAWEALRTWTAGRAPTAVLVTHGHHDHASLGAAWQAQGVPVVVHPADEGLTSRPQLQDEAEFGAYLRYLQATGAPLGVEAEARAALAQRRAWARRAAESEAYPPAGRGAHWPTGLRYRPFRGEPGYQGKAAEALWCPGHTPGNQVFVVAGEGWLFSGDQLLPGLTPTPAIQAATAPDWEGDWRFRSLPAFLASLERLRGMGFGRCYPGHGEPFDDVEGAIATTTGMIERRTERVHRVLREGGPATLYGLTGRLYPRGAERRFWQVAATVQGHLDLLAERGQAGCAGSSWMVL